MAGHHPVLVGFSAIGVIFRLGGTREESECNSWGLDF